MFDVTVLDRDRRPVRGLGAADFVVLEDNVPQKVFAVQEVNVPTPDLALASWVREAGVDVVSNGLESRRMIVLVLNDAYVGPAANVSAIKIANAVIDQLGPTDMAAVVGTQLTRMENFTNDREKLRAAVSRFVGQNFRPDQLSLRCQPDPGSLPNPTRPDRIAFSAVALDQCFMPAMTRVANVLGTAPPGRKLVMLIGGYLLGQADADGRSQRPDVRYTGSGRERELVERLHAANATVYVFDPRGVGPAAMQSDELDLAAETGGRILAGTNAPETLVPGVFAESSSYYLVSYETGNTDTTRKFREVRVSVNRPEAQVVARKGYFGPTASTSSAAPVKPLPPEDQAIVRAVPSGDVPMTVAAVPIVDPSAQPLGGAVVAVVSLHEPVAPNEATANPRTSRTVKLVTAAFEAVTFRSRGERRDEVALGLAPGATLASQYELTTVLPLRPGRYELRFAAERMGRAGSVFVSVEVPNFREERLSMSGLLLDRQPARRAGGVSISHLVPFLPTTERRFTEGDSVRAFAAVYQGLGQKIQPVSMTTEIRNVADEVVFTQAVTLDSEAFRNRTAEYRLDIPLARLHVGDYLLTTRAVMGERRIERTARFTVAP